MKYNIIYGDGVLSQLVFLCFAVFYFWTKFYSVMNRETIWWIVIRLCCHSSTWVMKNKIDLSFKQYSPIDTLSVENQSNVVKYLTMMYYFVVYKCLKLFASTLTFFILDHIYCILQTNSLVPYWSQKQIKRKNDKINPRHYSN